MARRGGFRGGFSRFDRRDVGLKPENALSRVDRMSARFILCSCHRAYVHGLAALPLIVSRALCLREKRLIH
jgi:hypothetical protein